jgi:prevent-host-death family protein
METLTSNQAKTQFGDLLLKVQRAPVEISRNGKPVAVMISADDYSAMEPLKMELLRQSLKRGLADLEAGKIQDGDSVFESMMDAEDK